MTDKPRVVDLMEALEESLKRAKAYEPCVVDDDGRCTRWSHNHDELGRHD